MPSGQITYQFEVKNTGPNTARSVQAALSPSTSSSPAPTCSDFSGAVRQLEDIAAGQTATGSYSVTCDGPGQITVLMAVQGVPGADEINAADNTDAEATEVSDPCAEGASALSGVQVSSAATSDTCQPEEPPEIDLSVEIQGPDSVRTGVSATYSAIVTNNGPDDLPTPERVESFQVNMFVTNSTRILPDTITNCTPSQMTLPGGSIDAGASDSLDFTTTCTNDEPGKGADAHVDAAVEIVCDGICTEDPGNRSSDPPGGNNSFRKDIRITP